MVGCGGIERRRCAARRRCASSGCVCMRSDGAVDAVRGKMRVMMVVVKREEGKVARAALARSLSVRPPACPLPRGSKLEALEPLLSDRRAAAKGSCCSSSGRGWYEYC